MTSVLIKVVSESLLIKVVSESLLIKVVSESLLIKVVSENYATSLDKYHVTSLHTRIGNTFQVGVYDSVDITC